MDTETETQVVMVMLFVFSLIGIVGNALVIYVFSNLKQKLTSTIFIIALATFDLVTSLVAMPFTAVVEYLQFFLHFDGLCKLYHFCIFAPVFFSAICFIGIAIDRYLCICHPFKHAMNMQRAKILVCTMATLALTLGIVACLFFGITNITETVTLNDNSTQSVNYDDYSALNDTYGYENYPSSYPNITKESVFGDTKEIGFGVGKCEETYEVLGETFFKVFQMFYASIFLVACIIVAILYALIYRTVIRQRRKKLKIKSNYGCCFGTGDQSCVPLWRQEESDKMTQTEEVTQMVHMDTMQEVEGNGVAQNGVGCHDNDHEKQGKHRAVRQGSISRKARVEKMSIANIRTAFMLSVVTLVYIVAFLPSWLMALRYVDMNVIIFYTYFVYNVANPFIYAFMNQNFRTQLKVLFKCKSQCH